MCICAIFCELLVSCVYIVLTPSYYDSMRLVCSSFSWLLGHLIRHLSIFATDMSLSCSNSAIRSLLTAAKARQSWPDLQP